MQTVLANSPPLQAGTPLTDADRWPWLERLAAVVRRHLAEGCPAVLSCSALKPEYRAVLRCGQRDDCVAFVSCATLLARAAGARPPLPPAWTRPHSIVQNPGVPGHALCQKWLLPVARSNPAGFANPGQNPGHVSCQPIVAK